MLESVSTIFPPSLSWPSLFHIMSTLRFGSSNAPLCGFHWDDSGRCDILNVFPLFVSECLIVISARDLSMLSSICTFSISRRPVMMSPMPLRPLMATSSLSLDFGSGYGWALALLYVGASSIFS